MKNSLILALILICSRIFAQNPTDSSGKYPPHVKFTAEQDHQNMMDKLGIKSLRPGPSGNESAPNHLSSAMEYLKRAMQNGLTRREVLWKWLKYSSLALRRTEVACLDPSGIQNDFFNYNTRIDHPDLKSMITRSFDNLL